jgi:hypothetical protein
VHQIREDLYALRRDALKSWSWDPSLFHMPPRNLLRLRRRDIHRRLIRWICGLHWLRLKLLRLHRWMIGMRHRMLRMCQRRHVPDPLHPRLSVRRRRMHLVLLHWM